MAAAGLEACGPPPYCGPPQYRSAAATAGSDAACAPVTRCSDTGPAETVYPTPTSDRVCAGLEDGDHLKSALRAVAIVAVMLIAVALVVTKCGGANAAKHARPPLSKDEAVFVTIVPGFHSETVELELEAGHQCMVLMADGEEPVCVAEPEEPTMLPAPDAVLWEDELARQRALLAGEERTRQLRDEVAAMERADAEAQLQVALAAHQSQHERDAAARRAAQVAETEAAESAAAEAAAAEKARLMAEGPIASALYLRCPMFALDPGDERPEPQEGVGVEAAYMAAPVYAPPTPYSTPEPVRREREAAARAAAEQEAHAAAMARMDALAAEKAAKVRAAEEREARKVAAEEKKAQAAAVLAKIESDERARLAAEQQAAEMAKVQALLAGVAEEQADELAAMQERQRREAHERRVAEAAARVREAKERVANAEDAAAEELIAEEVAAVCGELAAEGMAEIAQAAAAAAAAAAVAAKLAAAETLPDELLGEVVAEAVREELGRIELEEVLERVGGAMASSVTKELLLEQIEELVAGELEAMRLEAGSEAESEALIDAELLVLLQSVAGDAIDWLLRGMHELEPDVSTRHVFKTNKPLRKTQWAGIRNVVSAADAFALAGKGGLPESPWGSRVGSPDKAGADEERQQRRLDREAAWAKKKADRTAADALQAQLKEGEEGGGAALMVDPSTVKYTDVVGTGAPAVTVDPGQAVRYAEVASPPAVVVDPGQAVRYTEVETAPGAPAVVVSPEPAVEYSGVKTGE